MQDVITRRWGSGKGEHVWIIEIRKKNQIKRRITSTDEWFESVVFDSDETGQPPKQPPIIRHRFGIASAAAADDDPRQKRLEKFTLIAIHKTETLTGGCRLSLGLSFTVNGTSQSTLHRVISEPSLKSRWSPCPYEKMAHNQVNRARSSTSQSID